MCSSLPEALEDVTNLFVTQIEPLPLSPLAMANVIIKMRLECVLYIGCSFLAAIILAMILLIVSEMEQRRRYKDMEEEKKKKKGDIIYVADSPMPTMNVSSPRPSPFLTHRKVRRAGRARLADALKVHHSSL